ncbi:MAG: hypothetical protein ACI94Y_003841 [Maribacter sp.]|jgi:hypothetical protein
MGTPCTPSPTNKKEYITDIGKILVEEHGKKKYYQPEEVKKAHEKNKWSDGIGFSCWAMSTFALMMILTNTIEGLMKHVIILI